MQEVSIIQLTRPQQYLLYVLEYVFLLVLGGAIYYGIEVLYRGYSHVTMFFVGGMAFILIGLINEIVDWNMLFWWQMIIGDICVLILEFVFGVIFNIILGLNVWDYSDLPFNILGQICLPFALLWLPVVAFAIVVDDWTKYLLFHGKKPHYRFKPSDPKE